jgi:dihydrofolate synthase/folylpolyglutamate synthase
VITPLVSVITNVQWDHMHLLGNTLPKIAREKAGIIKPEIPVVVGEDQKGITEIFREKARKNGSPFYLAPKVYKAQISEDADEKPGWLTLDILRNKRTWIKEATLDLGGWYQMKNICTVMQTLDVLQDKGFETDRKRIRKALSSVKKLTGFAGRWQVIDKHPLTICDTAHNPDGVQLTMKQLSEQQFSKLHMVVGMVSDKDVTAVLKLFPKNATYYFCKPDIPRGMDAKELKQKAAAFQLSGKSYTSVSEALHAAKQQAGRNDLIYVGGSTFVVGEGM